VVPPDNAEYLHQRLPISNLDHIDADHFMWDDEADEYASIVISWWGGGYTLV
jgi:pimeloyl-ACP methyl ester carboxylesterase